MPGARDACRLGEYDEVVIDEDEHTHTDRHAHMHSTSNQSITTFVRIETTHEVDEEDEVNNKGSTGRREAGQHTDQDSTG